MNAKHERIVRTYTKITGVRLCTKATDAEPSTKVTSGTD